MSNLQSQTKTFNSEYKKLEEDFSQIKSMQLLDFAKSIIVELEKKLSELQEFYESSSDEAYHLEEECEVQKEINKNLTEKLEAMKTEIRDVLTFVKEVLKPRAVVMYAANLELKDFVNTEHIDELTSKIQKILSEKQK